MADLYVPEMEKSAAADDERPPHTSAAASTPALGGRIERLVARIVVLEFSIIAAICFLTSTVYFYAVLTVTPPTLEYLSAALLNALLIVLLSLGFKQYVAIQAQPRDRFMLSGLGAVALGFSLFLSCLFLFKIGDWYSRGTFFSQFLGVAAAMLFVRGRIHKHVRRAVQSGLIEARKAVLVGDVKSNDHIVRRLQRQGVCWASVLSFPDMHGYPASAVAAIFSADSQLYRTMSRIQTGRYHFSGRHGGASQGRRTCRTFVGATGDRSCHSHGTGRILGFRQGCQSR